jgi:hypothetical protein
MKKSYECEVATHFGPESCGAAREGGVEALIRERAGRVFSRVRSLLRGAVRYVHGVSDRAGFPCPSRYRCTGPSLPLSSTASADTSRGNREIPGLPRAVIALGRIGKSKDARR